MKPNHSSPGSRRRQAGITLAIMLVMLIIISLTSVAVIRGSLNADRVSNNLRVQTTATQAAQIGLRYCETEAAKGVPGITIHDGTGANWETFANWPGQNDDSKMAKPVPATFYGTEAAAPVPAWRPQCMAEKITFGSGLTERDVIIVTARGFSPDYAQDDAGRPTQGSVIWLQSKSSLATIETPAEGTEVTEEVPTTPSTSGTP